MIFVVIGILLMVLAVLAVSTIRKNRRRDDSKISFKEAMDLVELPVVTFYNGDRKLNFLLDTGSNVSHINSSVISSLNCKKTGISKEHMGIEGNIKNTEMCEMSIYYKNQKFEGEFYMTDLDNAFDIIKQESGVQIHGILGSKFFERYKYVLDFGELVAHVK